LRCTVCELVVSEKSTEIDINNKKNSINTENKHFFYLENLKTFLNDVDPSEEISVIIPLYYDSAHMPENYYYGLSVKTCYVLMNKYYFENVNIKKLSQNFILLNSNKKARKTLKISFIVAAYNESKTIASTLNGLLQLKLDNIEKEIVVVESNSTDETRKIIKQNFINLPEIKLIFQELPRGKGNAIREGLKHVSGDFICIQDADDEYDLEDYYNLIPHLIINGESFVIGSRHINKGWKMRKFETQPIRAVILNIGQIIFTKLINLVINQKLTDPFTMFKLFRRDVVKNLKLESDRFDFDHELVIKMTRYGSIPFEVPVNYVSRSFAEGKKIRIIRDPLNWIKAIIIYGLLNKK
jgi:hypothetical protein